MKEEGEMNRRIAAVCRQMPTPTSGIPVVPYWKFSDKCVNQALLSIYLRQRAQLRKNYQKVFYVKSRSHFDVITDFRHQLLQKKKLKKTQLNNLHPANQLCVIV
ncbi:CLUMA_CG002723, isoform A [Clunio marinus]|uniref:CLUMA_CG002723, isoform A n=1 Tax=Clunio marinus TaxID=568069 RepID=A0A1J1HS63_9DIPT|nr:CLUMA_CG002723, isoform A [Clunio marinus]